MVTNLVLGNGFPRQTNASYATHMMLYASQASGRRLILFASQTRPKPGKTLQYGSYAEARKVCAYGEVIHCAESINTWLLHASLAHEHSRLQR